MDKTGDSDAIGQVVELPFHCTRCGGAVVVECDEWRTGAPLLGQYFACPYCSKPNTLEIPGRLVWVTRQAMTASARH